MLTEQEYEALKAEPGSTLMPGSRLTDFVNRHGDTGEHAEVMRIFEICRSLNGLRTLADRVSACETLNRALEKFHFVPVLLSLPNSYEVGWQTISTETPMSELAVRAIQDLLLLVEMARLNRVRQCICGCWFVAQTNKKMVCSDRCRFQKFKQQAGNAFNQERAACMRDYRKTPIVQKRGARQSRERELLEANNAELERRRKHEAEANQFYCETVLLRNKCTRLRGLLERAAGYVEEIEAAPEELKLALDGFFPEEAQRG